MEFVAIEFPGAGIALGEKRKSFEFRGVNGGIPLSSQLLEVVTDELVNAGSESFRLLTSTQKNLVID